MALEEEDTGSHYRKYIQVPVTEYDFQRGYAEMQIDPYRLIKVYGITTGEMQQVLKKTVAAGKRGHNNYRQELEDIITACRRGLEILDEDERILPVFIEE